MWLGTAIALTSALALRRGVHALILRGLRAPRLAHQRLLAAGPPGLMQCLKVSGGHDPSEALAAHVPALMNFLQEAMPATPHDTLTLQIDSKQLKT